MSAFLILYYFQSEPGESVEQPNAFSIPRGSNTNITFGQFLDRFPAAIGKGKLHYRFRSDDSSCGYVWLDITDRNETVPTSSGVITCKILCLDSSATRKRCSRLRLKSNLNKGEEGSAVAMAKRLSQEKKGNVSVERENRNDTGKQSLRTPSRYTDKDDSNEHEYAAEDSFEGEDNYQQAPHPPSHTNIPRNENNERNNENPTDSRNENRDSGKSMSTKKTNTNTVDNLLDNDDAPLADNNSSKKVSPTAPINPTSRPSSAAVDRSPTAAAPKKVVTPPPVMEQAADMFHFEADSKVPAKDTAKAAAPDVHLSREELVTRREAALEGKVKDALEFKQELDENTRREAEELDQARLKHDKNLTNWSTSNKEKRNVRTLLTTMHTVLWTGKGNTWKTIGLGDVIEPKQVKLQYRKAMLVVHPDRCSSLTTETKFIAKRIFEGINEAYQEFLKKESV